MLNKELLFHLTFTFLMSLLRGALHPFYGTWPRYSSLERCAQSRLLRVAQRSKNCIRRPISLPDSGWHILAIFFVSLLSAPVNAEMPVRQLGISGHTLRVEVAHTETTRSQGLMSRQSMDNNDGMLFIFPEAGRHSMWMMNTDIPLSVAFLDGKGVILNIEDMTPRTATAHGSAGAAKYAIETNLGWFLTRNIKAGERVMGLDKMPVAE
jgi:uncharacterized membrane protein (UPF0127 family)